MDRIPAGSTFRNTPRIAPHGTDTPAPPATPKTKRRQTVRESLLVSTLIRAHITSLSVPIDTSEWLASPASGRRRHKAGTSSRSASLSARTINTSPSPAQESRAKTRMKTEPVPIATSSADNAHTVSRQPSA
ncbi:hypothetical protein RGU70_14325 [Herbaspirillum sp. RTI4]|uniref:hypothetical protein n=1 Tax=Herbaspirillum sp. RTI4 TaxID=3048640 RepID=UPI002AB5CD8D|nr:hypothetical protein [Herbaspirillum sp. RTI4]MDY7579491.1 hypothetical protein [Herbaspirillum sp. RTI4]MEA9980405.1 hypothetical protein [Herbaspirillum sp. RTI4]